MDRQFNLLYLSIHRNKKSKGLISSKNEEVLDLSKTYNFAVLDLQTDEVTYLFDEPSEEETISHLLYETHFMDKERRVLFNRGSTKVINNESLEPREPADRLIVCQTNQSKDSYRIWTFTKKGQNKRLIAEADSDTEWRVDVFNQKLLTFKRSSEKVVFKSYAL